MTLLHQSAVGREKPEKALRQPDGLVQSSTMIATLRFDCSNPDDAREHRFALAGRDALIALERLEQHCRSRIKYGEIDGEIDGEARRELEAVRTMIPSELTELLH